MDKQGASEARGVGQQRAGKETSAIWRTTEPFRPAGSTSRLSGCWTKASGPFSDLQGARCLPRDIPADGLKSDLDEVVHQHSTKAELIGVAVYLLQGGAALALGLGWRVQPLRGWDGVSR
jgi:hypothetical protein